MNLVYWASDFNTSIREMLGRTKAELKSTRVQVASCSINKFASIKGVGVVPCSHLQVPGSLAGVAVPAGTVHPPAARARFGQCKAGSGHNKALLLGDCTI